MQLDAITASNGKAGIVDPLTTPCLFPRTATGSHGMSALTLEGVELKLSISKNYRCWQEPGSASACASDVVSRSGVNYTVVKPQIEAIGYAIGSGDGTAQTQRPPHDRVPRPRLPRKRRQAVLHHLRSMQTPVSKILNNSLFMYGLGITPQNAEQVSIKELKRNPAIHSVVKSVAHQLWPILDHEASYSALLANSAFKGMDGNAIRAVLPDILSHALYDYGLQDVLHQIRRRRGARPWRRVSRNPDGEIAEEAEEEQVHWMLQL